MKLQLHNAVTSLQQFLADNQGKPAPKSVEDVRAQAEAANYPYPELAAQVFKFLDGKRPGKATGASLEEISEAFMTLLMDAEAVEALGGKKKAANPWTQVRNVIRQTGERTGAALLDIYNTVRETGLGYTPTILDLANGLREVVEKFGGEDDLVGLKKFARMQGLDAWQIALLIAWFKRKKKAAAAGSPMGDVPSDEDLEDILFDEELRAELSTEEPSGPWDVYGAQAQALRCLRHFGESLLQLSEEKGVA